MPSCFSFSLSDGHALSAGAPPSPADDPPPSEALAYPPSRFSRPQKPLALGFALLAAVAGAWLFWAVSRMVDPTPEKARLAFTLLALGAGLVCAITVYYDLRHPEKPPQKEPPVAPDELETLVDDGLHADDCMRLADEAGTEHRWAHALHWIRQAKALSPPSARILADEGEYLFQMGLFAEAFQSFAEAARLATEEGYCDYRAAQAAAADGKPLDEVLRWIEQALAKSPDLVGDLELFREFETVREMPGYQEMVNRAYARLGIDPADAGGRTNA